MFNKFMIAELLDKHPMIQVREVSGFSDAVLLVVDMSKVSSVAMRGMISHRQINSISKKIGDILDAKVFISYSNSKQKGNIESGLKALASANFKRGKLSDLDISFSDASEINIFVFCKDFSDEEKIKLEDLSNNFLSNLNIKVSQFNYEQEQKPEPSVMVVLRFSKKISPFNLNQLSSQLTQGGYHVLSNDWLNARLDLLRKKGLLIRSPAGIYRLTQSGLEAVPVTKSRQSSDIERILYLARKHL